jgi:hypothetical protein
MKALGAMLLSIGYSEMMNPKERLMIPINE